MRKFLKVASIAVLTLAFTAALSIYLLMRSPVRAGRLDMQAVLQMYPNYSPAQRVAILRRLQSQIHPRGRDLSLADIVRRMIARIATTSSGATPAANFSGNMTAVSVGSNHLMVLAQQPDCSLTLRDAIYTFNITGPVFSWKVAASTPHYEQVIHTAAGLTTTGGSHPPGCGDSTTGTSSREVVNGVTSSGTRVYAANYYDATSGGNPGFVATADANDNFQVFDSLGEVNTVVDLNVSDLNGDGNSDLVVISNPVSMTAGNATVGISLGAADGTFPVPTEITLEGNSVYSAVIDDFNGDGKKDIVVSSSGSSIGGLATYSLNFLAGKGDGTFQPVKFYTIAPPVNFVTASNSPYYGLISADLRGSGHKDIVSSTGVVLYGNGDGTFTPATAVAFPNTNATSDFGPNAASGDFNKDGKLDLAVNNGATIQLYIGKGDGTFTPGAAYTTIGNMGYLTAQDIDGDGNIDLFSGAANGGTLGGDKYDINMAYALMGNGDGTFRGAAAEPFVYTGTNLADLNGDKVPDVLSAAADGSSFTSYLGDGKGGFRAGPALSIGSISVGGKSYAVALDGYALGDINGDGIADLIYVGSVYETPNYIPGIFTAIGKGDGSFDAPAFVPAPSFVGPGDLDINPAISSVRLADMNHDGKLDAVYLYTDASYKLNTYISGLAIQLGNGDGTFKSTAILTQNYSSNTEQVIVAYPVLLIDDVNKDGIPDMFVLVAANSANTLQLYLGKGDGTFSAPATIAGIAPDNPTNGVYPLTLGDMNNDGILDLISVQQDPNTNMQVAIALGNGDGTFKAPNLTTYSAQAFFSGVAVADFDGDGKLDVATSDYVAGPQGSGISFGNGDGTIRTGGSSSTATTPAQSFYLGVGGGSVAVDLNGDGKPDILNDNIVLLNEGVTAVSGSVASSTALAVNASTITPGQPVTLTATVSGPAGNMTVPTGSVSFTNGSLLLGSAPLDGTGTATFTTSSLTVGSYSVTAVYGGDSNFSGSTSTVVTLTVTGGVATTTALTPSAVGAAAGTNLTFTAVVTPATGSTVPTGTVTFLDGSTTLGTGPLDGTGTATYSTATLAIGAHSITADYAGSTAFAPSASAAVSVTITAVAPSFTLALSPASSSVSSGSSATSMITLTPAGGFNQATSLACTGAPQNATCSISPSSVTPSGTATTTATLTITTGGNTSASNPQPSSGDTNTAGGTTALAFLGGGTLLGFSLWRRRRGNLWRTQMGLAVILVGISLFTGCGGGSSGSGGSGTNTPAGTYTITVTGTAGSLSSTTTYSLTVQ